MGERDLQPQPHATAVTHMVALRTLLKIHRSIFSPIVTSHLSKHPLWTSLFETAWHTNEPIQTLSSTLNTFVEEREQSGLSRPDGLVKYLSQAP